MSLLLSGVAGDTIADLSWADTTGGGAMPGLWIDWDADGFGTGANDDCTSLLIRAQYSRGSTPEITGAAQPGQAVFTLKNPGGLFDPDYAAGPLYGKLHDGIPVWFGANEDGTLNNKGATVRGRFAGRITEIAPLPIAGAGDSTPTVEIICEDALGWYSRIPVALSENCSPPPPPTPGKILLGVVIQNVFTGQDETIPPTVTVGTAVGTAWNLLAINSYPQGDPSGAGTQPALNVSLWWTDLPASNIDVIYVQQGPIAYLGAYVFEVDGIATGFSPVAGSGADLITRPGDNSFASLTASSSSVLFGGYGVQLLTYAYGCDITGISGTTAIVNLDNRGNAYIAYPGYQYIQPPWVFVGYKTGTGAMQLDSHVATSFNYTPNGRAWVAAAIPLAGTFSVLQQAGYTGGASVNSDITVSLPNPL